MTYTAIVRQRGQLTVPDALREKYEWLEVGSVVGLVEERGSVRITSDIRQNAGKTDWDVFLKKVKLARTFVGKRGNLAEMIVEDRRGH